MFANFFARPEQNLRLWDNVMSNTRRRLVAVAGNDAHSNVGVSLNDSAGKELIGLKLDPYERSFRVVRTHVLIRKGIQLTSESLLQALAEGHCYISFDIFADATGFDFSISNSDQRMGDEVTTNLPPRFTVSAPLPARIALIKNGNIVDQRSGKTVEFSPDGAGIYRVEVYLDSLPSPVTGKPWIISNPIYVR
jgi:hypothetical protein